MSHEKIFTPMFKVDLSEEAPCALWEQKVVKRMARITDANQIKVATGTR